MYWFCIVTLLLSESSNCSDVSSNVSVHLLSAGSACLIFLYLELCYKLTSHNFFKHFVSYGLVGVSGWCISGHSLARHSQKSAFSVVYGCKLRAGMRYIPKHSGEYFFRAPSRTGLNHSLFNILSGFCLCQSCTAVFHPIFNGLKVVTLSDWRSLVVIGWRETKIMPSSEQSSLRWYDDWVWCQVTIGKLGTWHMFCKMWRENISYILTQDFCWHPSAGLCPASQLSVTVCVMSDSSLWCEYITMHGHIIPET